GEGRGRGKDALDRGGVGAGSGDAAPRRAVRGPLARDHPRGERGHRRDHRPRPRDPHRRVQHPPRARGNDPALRRRARRDHLRRPPGRRLARYEGFADNRRTLTMTLPLIPTAVVGSHGKPSWWCAWVKALEQGDFGPGDRDEMFDDAANTAIRDMEKAGIDIITDGEVRRLDGYVDSYYAIIKGIEPLPVRRKAGPWGYDQQTRYEAVGRIETPSGGPGIRKGVEDQRSHQTRHAKAPCPGPPPTRT